MGINYKQIGLKLKELRQSNNLTQEELAEMSDLSSVYISKIERGKSCLSLTTLQKLSVILKFDIKINISNQKNCENKISDILNNCCEYEYKILYDVLIATKNSLDLNLQFKP